MTARESSRKPSYQICVHDCGKHQATWVKVDYGIWRSWTGWRMVDGEVIPGKRFVFKSNRVYAGRTV